ncbi:MAG: DUF2029 domain-containing protein [Planctomycetes bacterium]|nr:DUF2029 domain-containing protein [Planctomycetota bacterium]
MDKPSLERAFIVPTVLLAALLVALVAWDTDRRQWDFKIYYHAATVHAAGSNPYDAPAADVDLHYVYPPLSLYVFRPFTLLQPSTAYHVFLALKCAAALVLLWIWQRYFLREDRGPIFWLFALLAFHSAVGCDLVAGNISIFEQLALWTAFACFLDDRPLPFCGLIVAVALFKITPIVFLVLLPLSTIRRRWAWLGGSLAIFVAVLAVQYMATPQLLADFWRNASALDERGAINPATLAAVRDVTERLALPSATAWAAWIVLVTGVAATSWLAWRKLRTEKFADQRQLLLFLTCLSLVLVMPRMKNYSYILLIVPSYYVIARTASIRLQILLFVLVANPLTSFLGQKLQTGSPVAERGLMPIEYYPLLAAYVVWGVCIARILRRDARGSTDQNRSKISSSGRLGT